MDIFEWIGSRAPEIAAERDAHLTYARNFVTVTVFTQACLLVFFAGHPILAGLLGCWTLFLFLCLGFPPVPRFIPEATSSVGHIITGAVMTLIALAIQVLLYSVVDANLSRLLK